MPFLVIATRQNAGKSTFMHAFGHHHDDNWLELTSELPILTSTFLNTRFLSVRRLFFSVLWRSVAC